MKENVVTPVVGIGSVVETEDGLATVVGIKANAYVSPLGYRHLAPTVVLKNTSGNTFEVAGSIFEKLL